MTAALDLTGGHLNVIVNPGDTESFVVPLPADLTGPEWVWSADAVSIVVADDSVIVTVPSDVTAAVTYDRPAKYAVYVSAVGGGRTTMLSGHIVLAGASVTAVTRVAVGVPNPATGANGVVVNVAVAVGVPGPPGPSGNGSSTVLAQAAPSALWSWPNPLGRQVNATLYDAAGEQMEADLTVTPQLITVLFAQPQTGKLVIA